VGQFTDDRGAWLLLFHHGYQVLHALRNSPGESPERRRGRCCQRQCECQRVERSRRAPAPARAHRRHEGAARVVSPKFRSGVRGYQNPALGQTALISCRLSPSGLPSLHRKSAFQTPGFKPWGFFIGDQTLRNTREIMVSSRLAGTRLDSSTRSCGNNVRNSAGGRGGLHR
jgi:hypothetical protein